MTDHFASLLDRINHSALCRRTTPLCCLMSPVGGVQHSNTGGSHEVVPMPFDIEIEIDHGPAKAGCAADAATFGKPHGNWGAVSNSALAESEGRTGSCQVANDGANAIQSTDVLGEAGPSPQTLDGPATITLPQFIAWGLFFFFASFGAAGGFQ